MRYFYNNSIKRYLLTGAFITFVIGLVLRLFYAPFGLQELTVHMRIRGILGHPTSYYSYLSLFSLAIMYQILYIYIGAVCGYIVFRIRHRKGFTLLFSPAFKRIAGASALLFFYLFIVVDIVNPYQDEVSALAGKIKVPASVVSAVKYLFLPSMIKVEPFRPVNQITRSGQSTGNNQQQYQQPIYPSPQKRSQALPGGGNFTPQQGTNQSGQTPQYTAPTTVPQQQLTAAALLNALNAYRGEKGIHALTVDARLNEYALQRARTFSANGKTDTTGFQELRAKGGVYTLGFRMLGENSSYGATFMSADEIIRNHFGKYPVNNEQQLNTSWNYVGIGVDGQAIDIVFAGMKVN